MAEEYRDKFTPSKAVVAAERSGKLRTPTPEGRTIEQNQAIHAQAQSNRSKLWPTKHSKS
jgi:hypothetical protein